MRLAKYLAHAGVASRRAAEQLVFAGRVTVGGEVVRDPARDVDGSDGDRRRRRAVARHERPPRGLRRQQAARASSPPPRTRRAARRSSRSSRAAERLYPVGRLDADTTGLILLTDDGDARPPAHASRRFEVPRTYRAKVRHPPVRERGAATRCARASSSTTA